MAVEASISDKLSMLWHLQQIDSQLDELQILKGELPMEVSDLEDEGLVPEEVAEGSDHALAQVFILAERESPGDEVESVTRLIGFRLLGGASERLLPTPLRRRRLQYEREGVARGPHGERFA